MNNPDTHKLPRQFMERFQGRYAFLSVLGLGGSGMVYEVRNIQIGRIEAFKVLTNTLSPETTRRFKQEAKIASSLDHAGIVKVYDFGQEDSISWYTMQLIEGPSLSDIIDNKLRLDAVSASRLGMPLLDALAYSHMRGVIHRDIKPANILIQTSGYPCLTDFGIAKSSDTEGFTQTGYMMGTPAFMAPEQAEGKHVDGRADQYSLAITLYRSITGKLPFSSDEPMVTLVQRLHEDPEPIGMHCPDFPAPLGVVLMRALSRDRDDRYNTIEDMQSAMQSACDACHLRWDGPFEGFGHLSVVKKPIDSNKVDLLSSLDDADVTFGSRKASAGEPRTKKHFVIFGAAAAMAAAGGILYFSQPEDAGQPPSVNDNIAEGQKVEAPSDAPSQAPPQAPAQVPVQKPDSRPAQTPPPQALPPSVSSAPIARRIAERAQILEQKVPDSITIPPELAGKRVGVTVTVGEDGKVSKCIILNRNLPPAVQDIAKSIIMGFVFSPAIAEDGKPIASDITFSQEF
jgi:serine/threonine-protein kinase